MGKNNKNSQKRHVQHDQKQFWQTFNWWQYSEIETIVNNRPLTYVNDNLDNLEPLTPNHLLFSRYNSGAVIEENDGDISSRRRWKQVVTISNQFWKRRLIEYLPMFQSRVKWNVHQTNTEPGTFERREFTKRKMAPCSNHWRLPFIRRDCTSSKSEDDDRRIRLTSREDLSSGMWQQFRGSSRREVLETVTLSHQFMTFWVWRVSN